jgi:hypothetical protein
VLGSVHASPDTWWAGELTVPEDESGLAFIAFRRHGPALPADSTIDAVVPLPELAAVGELVAQLIAATDR